jgi:outer membrane lipoprotein LolB
MLALAAAIGACAPLLPTPAERAADAALEARREALAQLTAWQAVGRLSLQSPEQAWHAALVWAEEPGGYRVRLSGPLGQGAVEIRGEPGGVTLRTARGETYTAPDPETLMQQTLGWSVPLAGLRHWILGRDDPSGGPARHSVDPAGRPATLSQAGWEVHYLAYLPADPVDLPSRVQLDRGDLQARVVISRWDLGAR